MTPEVKRKFFLVRILIFSEKSKNVPRSEKKAFFGPDPDFSGKVKNMKNENLWGLNKPIQPSEIHSTLFKQRSAIRKTIGTLLENI